MGSCTNATAAPTSTTAGLLRPEQFLRHATLRRWPASAATAPWVENYWGLRWDLPVGAHHVSEVLPHPTCTLSVERGVRRRDLPDGCVLTGVVTTRYDTTTCGSGWVLAAKFRPGGLRALTGLRADLLRDRSREARDLLPAAVLDRLDALGPDGDDDDQVQRLDAALATLARPADPDHALVLDVVSTMLGDRSLLRVDQVEAACGVDRRRLQRLFAAYVGIGPKWVLARYRMHDAVTALDEGYAGTLVDLAVTHGWHDQAHFTRDFTALVGQSPGAYRARR